MKEIINSKYSAFFLAGLLFTILCAWFSKGFYHLDEHYQVLEFASYKLGFATSDQLPWEFSTQIRASLLPDLACIIYNLLGYIHLDNPFITIFLLRLFTGFAAWYITCRLCLLLLDDMKTEVGKRLFIFLCLFMWFVPSLNVRYSSENVAGILFLYGVYFILKAVKENKNQLRAFAIAGIFFGISFYIRIQVIAAMSGFAAWLLIVKKEQWKNLAVLIFSSCLLLLLNYFLDWCYYGQHVFTPLRYIYSAIPMPEPIRNFYTNIVIHASADYGVSPWWYYFSEFFLKAIPPLSIVLLVMFVTGIVKNLKNPLIWVILSFLLVHCLISHKELRFLFTVTYIGLYSMALGLDYLLANKFYLKIHKYVYTISLIMIIPLFLRSVFFPENIVTEYCYFLYKNISTSNHTLISLKDGKELSILGPKSTFYRSPLMNDTAVNNTDGIAAYMHNSHTDSAFFLDKSSKTDLKLQGYKTEKAYCFYPSWIHIADINHWMERTDIWTIYRVTKEENTALVPAPNP